MPNMLLNILIVLVSLLFLLINFLTNEANHYKFTKQSN